MVASAILVMGCAHRAALLSASIRNEESGMLSWQQSTTQIRCVLPGPKHQRSIASGGVMLDGFRIPEPYDGQVHGWHDPQIWQVIDTGDIGTFSDSISPPQLFRIEYPHQLMSHDSVSTSSDLTIRYSSTGSERVSVEIMPAQLLAHALDSTFQMTRTTSWYRSESGPGTGTFTVPASVMSKFAAERVIEIVVRAKNTKSAKHNGNRYDITSEVVALVDAFVKP